MPGRSPIRFSSLIPLEVNETIPFGVIHSKHPTEQVRKILKIIEFVNLEQQNFKLW